MAFIELVSESSATGILKKIYEAAIARTGGVANIIRTMSQHPQSCQPSMMLYGSLMKSPNAVEPAIREMLATVVSNVNDCYY
jgi:alkylhydroperoxidase family enzyme